MKMTSKTYQEYVLDDLAVTGLMRSERAGLLARILKRNAYTRDLHPNPNDEFSNPDIGPNDEIVSQYVNVYAEARKRHIRPRIDRIVVEKLSEGGYRILNGHHRWFAARKLQVSRMKIQLINLVEDQRILDALEKTERNRCVTFDIDEVLLCDRNGSPADPPLRGPLRKRFPQKIRLHAGTLMKELRSQGFDVWVYTSGYWSEEDIRLLFQLHGGYVFGVINGLKNKKVSQSVTEGFRKKYSTIIHVDNQSLMYVHTGTKKYEVIDFKPEEDWSSQVHQTVGKLMKTYSFTREGG